MSELLMTPRDAYLTASILHSNGMDVHIVMQHASRGRIKYVGDEERRAGKSAAVVVSADLNSSLEDLVKIKEHIAHLGFESELRNYNFTITGRSEVS